MNRAALNYFWHECGTIFSITNNTSATLSEIQVMIARMKPIRPCARSERNSCETRGAVRRARRILVAGVVFGLSATLWAHGALSARPATHSESVAIRKVAMATCRAVEATGPAQQCQWHGAKVSTVDPRLAYGEAVSEGFGGVLVQRRVSGSGYGVVLKFGGGSQPCSSYSARLRRALADLDLCFS